MGKKSIDNNPNNAYLRTMYTLTETAFGTYKKMTIESPNGQNRLSLVPSFGATITELKLAGQSVLDTYTSVEEMQAYKWMKSALLLPFPNRLKNGTYIWNNDKYFFHINDAITGNALHGFGLDKTFEVIQTQVYESHSGIKCRLEYNGELASYPFPFTFETHYALKDAASLSVTMTFYNDGQTAIPVGLGWHPYFQLNDNISSLKMKMPPCQMVGVDKDMIPTGKRYDYDEFADLRKIGVTVLDNAFALNDQKKRAEVLLESEKHSLRYWQQVGEKQFNYLQVFTHPDRHAIALEPMTCNIDAFNNGEGLVTLLPNEKMEVCCGVEVF